jgi:hypothetical protein
MVREDSATVAVREDRATVVDLQTSGVSWAAIVAGAISAAALTLVLLALGAGLGLASVSPWGDAGVSATTFKWGAGIYLCIVAVMASSVGGYLAARLRSRWTNIHSNEVFFRDTAHGLLAWALATLLSVSVLASAATKIVTGAAQGATAAAAQFSPADLYVDKLFRSDKAAAQPASQPASDNSATRSEVLRMWTSSFGEAGDLPAADRAYIAQLVASRTSLSQAEAEKRVSDTISDAKAAADKARKAAVQLSLWTTAALLLGAFAASLAAVEGGQLRDGTWSDRRLVPRSL